MCVPASVCLCSCVLDVLCVLAYVVRVLCLCVPAFDCVVSCVRYCACVHDYVCMLCVWVFLGCALFYVLCALLCCVSACLPGVPLCVSWRVCSRAWCVYVSLVSLVCARVLAGCCVCVCVLRGSLLLRYCACVHLIVLVCGLLRLWLPL